WALRPAGGDGTRSLAVASRARPRARHPPAAAMATRGRPAAVAPAPCRCASRDPPTARARRSSIDQAAADIEGFALRIAGMHLAFALGREIGAGAAGDGKNRVSIVVERPFQGDLPLLQGQRAEAFPGILGIGADAPAVVVAEQGLVILV